MQRMQEIKTQATCCSTSTGFTKKRWSQQHHLLVRLNKHLVDGESTGPYGRPLVSARATEIIRSIPVLVAKDSETILGSFSKWSKRWSSTRDPGPYVLCRESSAMASHGDKGEGDDAVERTGNHVDSNRRQSDITTAARGIISDWEIVHCAQYVRLTHWTQCS